MRTSFLLTTTVLFGLLSATARLGYAQSAERNSLKRQLTTQPADTTRVRLLNQLAYLYYSSKPDTTYQLAQQAYQLAGQLGDKQGQALSLNRMGVALNNLGDNPKALRLFQQSIQISRAIGDVRNIARTLNNTAIIYGDQKDDRRALALYLASLATLRQATRQSGAYDADQMFRVTYSNLGETYWRLNRLDSAEYYGRRGLQLAKQYKDSVGLYVTLEVLGHIREKRGDSRVALSYYQQSLDIARQTGELVGQTDVYLSIAGLYQKTGPLDSARGNARQALTTGQQSGYLLGTLKASQLLTQLYEGRDNTQALTYYKIAVAAKDSLFSREKVKQLLTLDFEEQQRRQELAAAEEAYQNRLRTYGLSALVGVAGLVALLLWRANRRQRRTNALLSQQKAEIEQQRSTVQRALTDLQAAQTRLIHQEKLASLGELTAGIAHEIQNPLNFVNNFAEVSTELIDELNEERQRSQRDADLEGELLTDLKQNLQKIHHHGRRADLIVKGMLAHSRLGTGSKQPTNLNALAQEYLKLAYQGMWRSGVPAKDKDVNAELVTDFDPAVGKVEVVPQEIGRVLLNLFNNAFYAIRQKQRSLSQVPAGAEEPSADQYQPTVWVQTRRVDGPSDRRAVEITVRDNGTGISEAVQQKMFQPFFTTKPTGEGTGLGLSLSYDIVTKGHGGTVSVDSEPGQYTALTIRLPA